MYNKLVYSSIPFIIKCKIAKEKSVYVTHDIILVKKKRVVNRYVQKLPELKSLTESVVP